MTSTGRTKGAAHPRCAAPFRGRHSLVRTGNGHGNGNSNGYGNSNSNGYGNSNSNGGERQQQQRAAAKGMRPGQVPHMPIPAMRNSLTQLP
ncbi:hypothetical protein [Streptomyces decoyicus]|uniref:hypothetical protein n=1 Tax=Streptomyces decoyicus TaxID=249567 RepID=UPI00365CD541